MASFDWLVGQPERFEQIQNMTQEQQAAAKQGLSSAVGMLNQPQQQYDFEPDRQKALSYFDQWIAPQIAESNTEGGRGSAYAQGMGAARAGLEENLAAMRSHIGLQQQDFNQRRMMSLFGLGMQPQFDTAHYGGTPGLLGALAGGAGEGLGSLGANWIGQKLGIGGESEGNYSDLIKAIQNLQQNKGTQQAGKSAGNAAGQGISRKSPSWMAAVLGGAAKGGLAGAGYGPVGAAIGAGLGTVSSMLKRG